MDPLAHVVTLVLLVLVDLADQGDQVVTRDSQVLKVQLDPLVTGGILVQQDPLDLVVKQDQVDKRERQDLQGQLVHLAHLDP